LHRIVNGYARVREYAKIRDPLEWAATEPVVPVRQAQALIAARIGPVRLIDNHRLDQDSS